MSTKTRIRLNDIVRVSFVSPRTKGNKEKTTQQRIRSRPQFLEQRNAIEGDSASRNLRMGRLNPVESCLTESDFFFFLRSKRRWYRERWGRRIRMSKRSKRLELVRPSWLTVSQRKRVVGAPLRPESSSCSGVLRPFRTQIFPGQRQQFQRNCFESLSKQENRKRKREVVSEQEKKRANRRRARERKRERQGGERFDNRNIWSQREIRWACIAEEGRGKKGIRGNSTRS